MGEEGGGNEKRFQQVFRKWKTNGRGQVTNKAGETIKKGGKWCHRTQETIRTWRHPQHWQVGDRHRAKHTEGLYKNKFTVGLDSQVLSSTNCTARRSASTSPPAVDQRHFPLETITRGSRIRERGTQGLKMAVEKLPWVKIFRSNERSCPPAPAPALSPPFGYQALLPRQIYGGNTSYTMQYLTG